MVTCDEGCGNGKKVNQQTLTTPFFPSLQPKISESWKVLVWQTTTAGVRREGEGTNEFNSNTKPTTHKPCLPPGAQNKNKSPNKTKATTGVYKQARVTGHKGGAKERKKPKMHNNTQIETSYDTYNHTLKNTMERRWRCTSK